MKLFIVDNDPMAVLNFVTALDERNWSHYSFSLKKEAVVSHDDLRRFLADVCDQRPDIVVLDAALTSKEEKLLDELALEGEEVSEESLSGFRYCRALANERLGVPIVFLTK